MVSDQQTSKMFSILRFSVTLISITAFALTLYLLVLNIRMLNPGFESTVIPVKTKAMMFDEYLEKFNKSYNEPEYSRRLSYFVDALREISILNRTTGAVHGLTKFSDMSKEEISKFMIKSSGFHKFKKDIANNCINDVLQGLDTDLNHTDTDELPDVVDWRKKNVIGPILNQEKCAACYAFSVVGLMESMALIQKVEKTYIRRSIQEVMDCTYDGIKKYCHGGDISATMEKLCYEKMPIVTEKEYPLTLQYEHCTKHHSNNGRRIKRYWVYFKLNEITMQRYLANYGPIAVVVNAEPWLSYTGNIIKWNCVRSGNHHSMDHVVQVVGYDKSGSEPYYIVRNSWGEDFGDKGYVKLIMNKNICGISDEVSRLEVY